MFLPYQDKRKLLVEDSINIIPAHFVPSWPSGFMGDYEIYVFNVPFNLGMSNH